MEDINLQAEIEKEKIIRILEDIFPAYTVFHYSFDSKQPKKLDLENPLHIFFHIVKRYAYEQFDLELRIYRTSSACETERALFIAKKISEEFSIPTLVRNSTLLFKAQDINQSLSNFLFKEGKTFIVDENFSTEKEYLLPAFIFDSKGDYMGIAK